MTAAAAAATAASAIYTIIAHAHGRWQKYLLFYDKNCQFMFSFIVYSLVCLCE